MLESVSDAYDKSEGSFFYDLLAPIAIEIEKLKIENEETLYQSFVQLSSSNYLTMRCAEININRKSSAFAEGMVFFEGVAGTVVPAGTLVASDTVYFQTTSDFIIDNISETGIICTVTGSEGNVPSAAIKNIVVSVAGITSVINKSATVGASDEETDDELRARYLEAMSNVATSGNESHYKQWATEVAEVTSAKVESCWNGNGTVRVIISTAEGPADDEVITTTSDYIETKRPVGAKVTVVSVKEIPITITSNLIISSNIDTIQKLFEEKITSFFVEIAMEYDYISIAQIGAYLIETLGVVDYSNLQINGSSENLSLDSTEVPVLSEVIFNV